MSQQLCPTDFNNLIVHLKEFYDEYDVKRAIDALIQFYKEEAFDNDDITNDWIQNDFKNCDGIDRFMSTLNYPPPINSTQNKEILFNWFCYWLLPNVTKPPERPTLNTTVDEIAKKFKTQLPLKVALFKHNPNIINGITNTFVQFCKDENYIEIEDLLTDLAPDDIDESFIMSAIIEKYAQYQHIKQQIFEVLYDIIVPDKYRDYAPFQLSAFEWKASHETWKITNELCTNEIRSFFQNEIEQQNLEDHKPTEDKTDWSLMSAKALDVQNNFPFLINIIDAFARYRAEQNCQLWCGSIYDDIDIKNIRFRITPKSTDDAQQHPTSVGLTPASWLKETTGSAHGLYCYIKKTNARAAEYILSAIHATLKRALHKFTFNHIMDATVYDDYSIFCSYLCAMNKFVYGLFDVTDDAANECLPLQIDLWIIPRLAKKNVHTDYEIPPDIYDVQLTDILDDDEEESKHDAFEAEILELGKNAQGEKGKIWNLEDNLRTAGYKEGYDYWCHEAPNDGDYFVGTLMKNMRDLWKKNKACNSTRYARYIMIIDRRNPEHIKKKKMEDDTQSKQWWSDKMYLIRPKLKQEREYNPMQCSNNYNKIAKEYDVVLNETFIGNTKDYLFPMPRNHGYTNDFSGLDAGNGYKFVVSFHLYFSKVKMYWYYGQSAIRFCMKDIIWLWPRYFKLRDDIIGNKNCVDAYQRLDDQAKTALQEVLNRHPLNDLQFDEFVKQINSPPFKSTRF